MTPTQGIQILAPIGMMGGFGTMVKYAGDVNGDGIGDMMIAAASAAVTAQGQGVVYVIFGKNGLSSIDLNSLSINEQGFRILGSAGQKIGASLNTAGDVNGDGIDDIMAGTTMGQCSSGITTCGTIAIIYGRNNIVSDVEMDSLTSTGQGFIIAGGEYQIGNAESIRSAGDLNNDGIGDIIFGASSYFNSLGSNIGMTYIIYGSKAGLSDIDLSNDLSASQGFTITGPASGGLFGSSAAAGDIDGDGYLDVIVGASGSNSGAGGIYVLFGNKEGFSNINLADHAYEHPQVLAFIGNPSDTMLGRSLKAATDFNDDNVNDFVAIGSSIAYALYGNPCESIVQCSSTSLSPICYASKGCVCGEYNLYFQVNQCVTQCSDGYYLNNPICEPCPDSCSSCTSASTCQTCQYSYILEGTSCVPACPEDYYFDGSTCQSNDVSSLNEINTINSVTDTTQYMADGTYTVAGVVASSDPGSVTSSMLAKMLQYIRYMNLPYSQRLEKTFKFQNSTYGPYGLGPKMPLNLILELPFHEVPNRFWKFHVFSCFLINFCDSLIFLAIIFGVLLIVALVEWIATKIKQRRTFYPIIRLGRVSIQNFFIMQFYNVFGDIVMFIALDWKQVDLTNGDATLSFLLSIICLCTGCAIIGIHIYILMKFYKLRRIKSMASKLDKLSKEYEWSGVMYLHFKNNTFISQSFLLLYVIRNCLYNLVLVLLYDYPLIQTILIMSMSVFMLTYLLAQRPFTTLINQVQHIVYEIIFLLVNICVLIIAQMNFEKSGAYPMRDRLCEAVIYTSLIFSFIPQVFLGIKVLIAVIVWYQTSRSKSYKISQKAKVKSDIPKRIQKERAVQFPKNQNQSLDDSSAALTINQDVSSLYLRNQVSFKAASQTDTSLQINKFASASNSALQQNQELQGTSFVKADQKQFNHNQQYEDETLDISRKERKEENTREKRTNVFQKNKNVKQSAKRIRKRNPHLVE